MADLARRLDRLEERMAPCVCDSPENRNRWAVVDYDWSAEQIQEVVNEARFNCPAHGVREPTVMYKCDIGL